jgi:hypothetical protein
MSDTCIKLDGSWAGCPPAWRNFIRDLQQKNGCYDGWDGLPVMLSHEDIIADALVQYQATKLMNGLHLSEVIFKNEKYKTLFLLKYSGPEPDDSAVGMIYAPFIPLMRTDTY